MGIHLRKLMRSRVIVVFGATSRIGRATMEVLATQDQVSVALVAAVESAKDPRVQRLKRATNCFVVQCNFAAGGEDSLRRAVRNTDAVLLVPALSESGVRFSRRVVDAVTAEQVARLVVVSSILAAPDLLGRCRTERTLEHRAATEAVGATPAEVAALEGYEAVEVHARGKLPEPGRAITLRIPLLMETLLYCRDEILFANRFLGCFGLDTRVPCISVRDVGYAAAEVLANPKRKYEAVHRLTGGPNASCSPNEVLRTLTTLLERDVKYRQLSDEDFLRVMKEKGTPDQVAQGTVGLRMFLEDPVESEGRGEDTAARTEGNANAHKEEDDRHVHLPDAFRTTNDFRALTKRDRMTPRQWLQRYGEALFARTPQNQVQLFVFGSGEALFLEISKFVTSQMTAPSELPPREVGDSAIPTVAPHRHSRRNDEGLHAKVTLCTVKAAPGCSERTRSAASPSSTVYQLEGAPALPMSDLLKQLSSLDVVVIIPPLRLGGKACLDAVRAVIHAAIRANAWGVVLVSSLFVDSPTSQESPILEQLEAIESCVKSSGISFSIVRLPLFMEYFLALSHCEEGREGFGSLEEEKRDAPGVGGAETEVNPQGRDRVECEDELVTSPPAHMMWPLLEPKLAHARVYLMALEDAAKALVAIAFGFPLHRGKTRELYTNSVSMQEVQRTLQKHAHKARFIRLSRVDALRENQGREFWRIAYWPRPYTQQFLECAVELSQVVQTAATTAEAAGGDIKPQKMVLPVSQSFEDITDLPPLTLDQWAEKNSKCYTHALAAPRADE